MIALLADTYVHTIDPIAIPITREFGIRWYGLSYAAGFLVAWLLLWWMAKSNRSLLQPQNVGDLMLYAIVGVLVGGRLGYVFFYDPSLLTDFSSQFPWWGVLAINRGGMASHGGMIGVLLAVALYAKRYSVPMMHVADLGALAAPPGLFLGRIANFINGELLGRAVADQQNPPWWSMKFPQELRQWESSQLVELRPIISYANVEPRDWDRAIIELESLGRSVPRETYQFVNAAVERIILHAQAGDQQVIEHLRETLTALYPSQLMQATTDGPILFGALALLWLRPRKPGVIGGAFLVVYGILRIITEQFRQPDEGVAAFLGLTRGQTLSSLMILAGVALLAWSLSRKTEPVSGLLRGKC